MKIVQALEKPNILQKGVTKTIKNKTKEQKGGFVSLLLGTRGWFVKEFINRKKNSKSWFQN